MRINDPLETLITKHSVVPCLSLTKRPLDLPANSEAQK